MSYLPYIELFAGLTWLFLGGDLLVRGAVALARKARISPIVVGLTVVAMGTSAPELFVAVQAALTGYPALAVGNVVGSNIANVLLVVGLPAAIYPMACDQPSLRTDSLVMVAATLLFTALVAFGPLTFLDGAILVAGLVAFMVYVLRSAGPEQQAAEPVMERVLGLPTKKRLIVLLLVGGALFLPIGAYLLVDGSVQIAEALGVSEALIGLTVVAVGTSLPELVTTAVAAFQKHSDVAIGNVVGSNVFNLLAIMGITSLVTPESLPIDPSFLSFDVPIMTATALLLLALIWRRTPVGRAHGLTLVAAYGVYVLALFARSR